MFRKAILLLLLAGRLFAGEQLRLGTPTVVFPGIPAGNGTESVVQFWPVSGTALSTGGYSVVAGQSTWNAVTHLARLNPDGSVLTSQRITNSPPLFSPRLFATPDGGYLEAGLPRSPFSGTDGNPDERLFFRRFGPDGHPVAETILTNTFPGTWGLDHFLPPQSADVGHLVFRFGMDEGADRPWGVGSVALDGRIVWTSQSRWRTRPESLVGTREGGALFLVQGETNRVPSLVRLAPTGTVAWSRPTDHQDGGASLASGTLCETADGSVLVGMGPWLSRHSPVDGSLLWRVDLGTRASRLPPVPSPTSNLAQPASIRSLMSLPPSSPHLGLATLPDGISGTGAAIRVCAIGKDGTVTWATSFGVSGAGTLPLLPHPDGSVAAIGRTIRDSVPSQVLLLGEDGWTAPSPPIFGSPEHLHGFPENTGFRFLQGGPQVLAVTAEKVDLPGAPVPIRTHSTPDVLAPGLAEFSVEMDGDSPMSIDWGMGLRRETRPYTQPADGRLGSTAVFAIRPGFRDGFGEVQAVVSNRSGTRISPLLSSRIVQRSGSRRSSLDFASNSIPILYADSFAPDVHPQWFRDGDPIPGAVGPSLPLTADSTSRRHVYEFRVAAENGSGTNAVIEVGRTPEATERWRREEDLRDPSITDLVSDGDKGLYDLLDGQLRRLDPEGAVVWQIPGTHRKLVGLGRDAGVLVQAKNGNWSRVGPDGSVVWTTTAPEGGYGDEVLPTDSGGFWCGNRESRTFHRFSGTRGLLEASIRVDSTGFLGGDLTCDAVIPRKGGGLVITASTSVEQWVDWYAENGNRSHRQTRTTQGRSKTKAVVCDAADQVHVFTLEPTDENQAPRGRLAAVDPEDGWSWFETPSAEASPTSTISDPSSLQAQLFRFPDGDVVATRFPLGGRSWLVHWNGAGQLVGAVQDDFAPLVPVPGNRMASPRWDGTPGLEVIGPDLRERARIAFGGSPTWNEGRSSPTRIAVGSDGRIHLDIHYQELVIGAYRSSRLLLGADLQAEPPRTNTDPVFVVQPPEPRLRYPGEGLDLPVAVSEWPGQEIAWYRNGQRIPGVSGARLHLEAEPTQESFPIFPGPDTYHLEVRRGGRVWLSRPYEDLRSSHPRESAVSLLVGSVPPSSVLPLPARNTGAISETWNRDGTPLSFDDLDAIRAGVRPSDSGTYSATPTNSPRIHLRVEDRVRLEPLTLPILGELDLKGDGKEGAYLVRRDWTTSPSVLALDHLDGSGSNTWSTPVQDGAFALAGETPRFLGIGSTVEGEGMAIRISRIDRDGRIVMVHREDLATNHHFHSLTGRGNQDHAGFLVGAVESDGEEYRPVPFLLHLAPDGTFRRELLPDSARFSEWDSDWTVASDGRVWLATPRGLFVGPAPWIQVDSEPFHSVAADASGGIVAAATNRIAAFTLDGRVLWNRKESARQVRITPSSLILGTAPEGSVVLDRDGRVLLRSPRSEERITIPGTELCLTGWAHVDQTPYFLEGLELQTDSGQRVSTFHPSSTGSQILHAVPTSPGRALFVLRDPNGNRSLWSVVADSLPSGPRLTVPGPDIETVPFETVSLKAAVDGNEGGPLNWAWESEGGRLAGDNSEATRIPSVTSVLWRRVQAWNGSGIVTSPWIRIRPNPTSFGIPRLDSEGRLELRFAGNPAPHRLEGSEDLIHWTPLGYLSDETGNAISGVGVAKPNSDKAFRFYRALEIPR